MVGGLWQAKSSEWEACSKYPCVSVFFLATIDCNLGGKFSFLIPEHVSDFFE